MTEIEFERRLRQLEDWRLQHDEKCNGREERIFLLIESLAKSSGASLTDLEETFRDFSGRSASYSKRLRAVENQLHFARGWMVASAAIGGVLGGVLTTFIGHFLK